MLAPLNLCRRFQSTLPARGATSNRCYSVRAFLISIHAPRTGSDQRGNHGACVERISIHAPRTGSDFDEKYHIQPVKIISIHAPRTGSDRAFSSVLYPDRDFNPRSPHGERRLYSSTYCSAILTISIHAPRTGSDRACGKAGCGVQDFNPRSPHGERPGKGADWDDGGEFQSTLPARGATDW